MNEIVIHADRGEIKSGIPDRLKEHGISVVVEKLEIGDYLCSDRVCVERKTAEDFVALIKTKRLFRQITNLLEEYERPIFLIEGYHLYKVMGVHPSGIRGALSMIAVNCGIPVLFSKDKNDTAELLLTIARQEQAIRREISFYLKRKTKTPSEEIERILESFPGIGPTLSKSLLMKYRTIAEILSASVDELKTVPKIGEKKASLIREILDREYMAEEK